jgi:hypothetical protein
MKLGIPPKSLANSDDAFLELNSMLFSNESVIENYETLYGRFKFIFDCSDERSFEINKISDIFYKSCKPAPSHPSFKDLFLHRCEEVLEKYTSYVSSVSQIALVHMNPTHDSLYICVSDEFSDNVHVPHIKIPGQTVESRDGIIIFPFKNFIDNFNL